MGKATNWGTLHGLFSLLSRQPRTAQGWYHPQCAGPSHISHESKTHPRDRLTGQSSGSSSSVKVPLSQVTLICDNLTQTNCQMESIIYHLEHVFLTILFVRGLGCCELNPGL